MTNDLEALREKFSIENQKNAFRDARLEIAEDLERAGLVTKLISLTGENITCSGEVGSNLPIVVREPYTQDTAPSYDIDPILTDGYEYGVGFEVVSDGPPTFRELFPVFAHMRGGEPIPLQPEVFSAKEAQSILECVRKFANYRIERFPFAAKDLKGFII